MYKAENEMPCRSENDQTFMVDMPQLCKRV